MNLKAARILILGGGRSGRAAAALCLREGADVALADSAGSGGALESSLAPLAAQGLSFLGDAAASGSYDLAVLSPGIHPRSDWASAWLRRCSEMAGETELASRFYHGHMIGITGTNGKTTTTGMTAAALRGGGLEAFAAGNIGTPLSEVVVSHPEARAVALELSSFQLETISTLKPDTAVWLNFSADHLDWHASLEEYRAAKERIFLNMGPDGIVVVPPPMVATATAGGSRARTFDVDKLSADYHLRENLIIRDGKPLAAVDSFRVRGRHNHANLLAALAAAEAAAVDDTRAIAALTTFTPPEHRYQLVATAANGICFINDSKSTNPHSLASALGAETRPVVLLAGGAEKGLDYSEITPLLTERCRALVVFGELGARLEREWSQLAPLRRHPRLDAETLRAARDLAAPGDIILLSPGTSSFDQFTDYTARGRTFAKLVDDSLRHQP